MKTQTRQQTAHCFAAVLSLALAFATGGASAANVVWNGNAANGSLSDGGNWDGGVAPVAGDTLDFSAVTSATTLNADFADGREFATLLVGSGDLTLNGGTLKLTTVTNAYTLGVASGATLAISGDLVGYAARNTKPLLRSNEGTVTVGGLVRFRSSGTSKGESIVSQYASSDANSTPIIANGLAYHADSWSDYLVASLGSMNNGPGRWVIGAGGTSYPSSRQIGHSGFRVIGQDVTLGSSADWTFTESYRKYGNDLYIRNAGKVTVDTSDYLDSTAPHTVTFEGYINEESSLATALVVKGCGTLVLKNTTSGRNNVIANTFAVTETATLQINKGKSITGNGTVSLASGTKLLVPDASATVGLPSFAPAAGSSIVITNLTAGTPAIALTGSLAMPTGDGKVTLKIGGTTQLEDGIYTILSSANALPADVVDHLTLDASEVVSGDCSLYAKGGVLLLLVGIAEPGYGIWVGGTDNNLSTAANWLNEETPRAGDTLNFKTIATATTLNSDFEDARVFATAVFGSGVVTLTGSLYVNTLTNAYTLAVASGATLDIAGDLVSYAANNTKPLLYSNEGSVRVGGTVRCRANSLVNRAVSTVCQYAVATANSTPIVANGIAYQAVHQPNGTWYPDYLVANLGSMNNGAGKWVVGSNGFSFPSSRQIDYSGFRVFGQQEVTLHSSDDWTFAESYRYFGNDLYLRDTATVAIDTTDWNDETIGRIVTLKGFINAQGSAATPLTITGCGTVVLDSKTANNHTNVVTGAIAVTDGATLQINKDVVVGGSGTISLAAGTTLALPSNADRTFTTPDIIPVTLPDEGTATINIDGGKLRNDVDYVLLNSVPTGYAEHLVVTGTALDGRHYRLADDGEGHLVMNVVSPGTVIYIR